jgi:hypothetical protein
MIYTSQGNYPDLDAYFARPRITPYRFDPSKCTEPTTFIRHMGARLDCAIFGWPFSLVPSKEEVAAREREAASWNIPGGFNGD